MKSGERLAPRVLQIYTKNRQQGLPTDIYVLGLGKALIACEAVRMVLSEVEPEKIDGEAVYDAVTRRQNADPWGSDSPAILLKKNGTVWIRLL